MQRRELKNIIKSFIVLFIYGYFLYRFYSFIITLSHPNHIKEITSINNTITLRDPKIKLINILISDREIRYIDF